MLIHELNAHDCREVLGRCDLGRLAYVHHDQPYVVPIHFSFDADRNCIYAFSTVGEKIRWMRENPKICLEVEEIRDKNHWTTVLATGRYEEIHQKPEEAEARQRAEQLFLQRRLWWLPATGKVDGRENPDVVVYRIQIDRLTGRRATRKHD
jgi:nitroimidazol reductase NimA-like FMN-containing flavoprotein (pyridoxamine 5'-phosphate oxidase superfamily)